LFLSERVNLSVNEKVSDIWALSCMMFLNRRLTPPAGIAESRRTF